MSGVRSFHGYMWIQGWDEEPTLPIISGTYNPSYLWLSLLSSYLPPLPFLSASSLVLPMTQWDTQLQLCIMTSALLQSLLLSSNSSLRIWLVYLLHGNATFVRQFPRPMDRVGPLEGALRSTCHETQQILSSDFMILPCNYFFKLLWK